MRKGNESPVNEYLILFLVNFACHQPLITSPIAILLQEYSHDNFVLMPIYKVYLMGGNNFFAIIYRFLKWNKF